MERWNKAGAPTTGRWNEVSDLVCWDGKGENPSEPTLSLPLSVLNMSLYMLFLEGDLEQCTGSLTV